MGMSDAMWETWLTPQSRMNKSVQSNERYLIFIIKNTKGISLRGMRCPRRVGRTFSMSRLTSELKRMRYLHQTGRETYIWCPGSCNAVVWLETKARRKADQLVSRTLEFRNRVRKNLVATEVFA